MQLGRFFQEGEFATEVTELQLPLVSAAIAVYYRMCGSMLPTPAKSHYTFNLRDLSKVEGIILSLKFWFSKKKLQIYQLKIGTQTEGNI